MRSIQCLSQDLETGRLKLAVVKIFGVQIFKGDHNILHISTINMYKFINKGMISFNNVMGMIRMWKNSIISLRLRFSRNSTLKNLGVLRGSF